METAEVQNVLGRVEEDMVVECFVIYMAAHGIDVWAVGGTCRWENGGGDGDGAGPLDAGVFFEGMWMLTERGRSTRVTAIMIRVKRARWVQGPSRPGRTAKHPCAVSLSGHARAAFLIKYIAL